jgi:N-methylhydantoinase B
VSEDPVRMAVLASRLDGIASAMMNTLGRTGRSGVINTARDYSCCILTADGELVTTAESLPIHVMSGPDVMARRLVELWPALRRGDAFLHNSPYEGNSHAADHCMLVPVVDDDGVHRFTVLAKAHQADCGNSVPTTYFSTAQDVYEEGALIFPMVRVQEGYVQREDIVRMCRTRIRVPDQWYGDYLALLGATRIGERRLLELGAEIGWDVAEEHARAWLDYSERRMIAVLRELPRVEGETTSTHDPMPGIPEGLEIRVQVATDPDAAMLEVDLRDNADCQPCGLNLTEATSRTAALVGVFNAIGAEVPPNSGSQRRVSVLLRENCVVGVPRHPTSCSLATTNFADRVASGVQRLLGELIEGVGLAECGSVIAPSVGVISGNDPRARGRPFVDQLYLAFTAGAGAPSADAWLTLGHNGNGGFVVHDSVEMDELRYPIRVQSERLLPDTEGPGRFRGAPSAYAEYGPVDCELEVHYASDGTINRALGVRGGLEGNAADQWLRRSDGSVEQLQPWGPVVLRPGERIISVSSGGGGYGDPRTRDSERVARDVRERWITAERARDVYGVVLDADGGVDADATMALRADHNGVRAGGLPAQPRHRRVSRQEGPP